MQKLVYLGTIFLPKEACFKTASSAGNPSPVLEVQKKRMQGQKGKIKEKCPYN
jgi:hypothetical protein